MFLEYLFPMIPDYDYFTEQFPVDSIVMLCDKKNFDCLICNSFNFDFYEALEVNCSNDETVAVNLVTIVTFSRIGDHISTNAKVFGKGKTNRVKNIVSDVRKNTHQHQG